MHLRLNLHLLIIALVLYTGFFGTTGQENDTTKYRHKLLNNSVNFGTPVVCQYDLQCGDLTASAIYGGAINQINTAINNAVSTLQNTLQNVPGKGEILLESNFIKRIFTVSPLEIKTYLNLGSSTDPKNANIEFSLNKEQLFNQLYHCAGIINEDGTIALSKGVGFTVTKGGIGIFNITFNSPHPNGAAYLVSTCINTTTRAFLSVTILSNESIRFSGLNNNGISIDVAFHFQIDL